VALMPLSHGEEPPSRQCWEQSHVIRGLNLPERDLNMQNHKDWGMGSGMFKTGIFYTFLSWFEIILVIDCLNIFGQLGLWDKKPQTTKTSFLFFFLFFFVVFFSNEHPLLE